MLQPLTERNLHTSRHNVREAQPQYKFSQLQATSAAKLAACFHPLSNLQASATFSAAHLQQLDDGGIGGGPPNARLFHRLD